MILEAYEANETAGPADFEIARLRAALPEYFDKDGGFMLDRLQEALRAGEVNLTREGYELKFLGKSYAKYLTSTKTETVVVPDLEHNSDVTNASSENLYVVGDNLDALKHLLGSYSDKVKCIYIDPPYNTGSDGFVYNDDFGFTEKHLMEKIGLGEDEARRIIDLRGRSSHSAWLTFMYPRLELAKELLADDGVIFISIDNNEHTNLRAICDEVFGEQNFVETIVWNKRIPKNDKGVGSIHEYVLVYVRNASRDHEFTMPKDGLSSVHTLLEKLKRRNIPIPQAEAEIKQLYKKQQFDRGITLYNSLDKDYRLWGKINMSWPNADTFGPTYDVLHPVSGVPVAVPDRGWRWKKETFEAAAGIVDGAYSHVEELPDGSFRAGKIWFARNEKTQPSSISYLDELDTLLLRSILSTKSDGGVEVEKLLGRKGVFSYPKPTSILRTLISSVNMQDGDIVLDFFSGSATSAHAVMQLNAEDGLRRRYLMVQLPEAVDRGGSAFKAGYSHIDEIGRDRIRRSAEKIRAETDAQIDYGFRLFRLTEPSQKTVDELQSFDPNNSDVLFSGDFLSKFSFGGTPGDEVALTTWLVQDGFGLTPEVQTIRLDEYELRVCRGSGYVIQPGLTSEDVLQLVSMLENGELDLDRMVVFGYSVTFSVMHELKKNLASLKSGRTISVIERF
ncbi:DNA methyltransferase [Arthrobacter sp. zg-Y1219]|uniref:site-specific DNA-methyltransferase n=1 Tax=Arthrobacter sp. zg-Y1219 TaxID=3049067 RepID=UPI0024C41EFF|nr:site-specific DNA-methyltransferase [Arthrobacter sp. zg-Y1219]MDK1359660.1 DNA methyltransferase [Arthrobacter sp. zg-Y1219]